MGSLRARRNQVRRHAGASRSRHLDTVPGQCMDKKMEILGILASTYLEQFHHNAPSGRTANSDVKINPWVGCSLGCFRHFRTRSREIWNTMCKFHVHHIRSHTPKSPWPVKSGPGRMDRAPSASCVTAKSLRACLEWRSLPKRMTGRVQGWT